MITGIMVFAVATLGLIGFVKTIPAMVRRARDRSQRLGTPDRIEDHGLVTLRGTVKQLGTPLTAPLTGRGCVAYRATGRTFTKVGHRKEVDAEETETAMTPFVLVTKHGEVTVDGTTCELPTRSEPIIPRKLELEQKFMKRVMLIGSADTAGFDEIVVKPGMKIAVYGVVREEVTSSGGETGFREAPKQLRISGEPIVIDLD